MTHLEVALLFNTKLDTQEMTTPAVSQVSANGIRPI